MLTLVKSAVSINADKRVCSLYRCDCGVEKVISDKRVKSRDILSCGCLQLKMTIKHGMYKSREHNSWGAMKQRCGNPNYTDYHNYGGRGISVCPEWKSFEQFYADMGPRPPGMSLDRIDNDGNYEPSNCKWSTRKEQRANMRPDKYH